MYKKSTYLNNYRYFGIIGIGIIHLTKEKTHGKRHYLCDDHRR